MELCLRGSLTQKITVSVVFAHSFLIACTCFFNGACRWKDRILQCWCWGGNGTEQLPGRQCGAGGLLSAAAMLPVVLCTCGGEVGREAAPAWYFIVVCRKLGQHQIYTLLVFWVGHWVYMAVIKTSALLHGGLAFRNNRHRKCRL